MKRNYKRFCSLALALCMSAASWAIDKVESVYQIGTVDDLKAFAELIESGEETNANAVLTADINLGLEQVHIGVKQHYNGYFDGKGHTITVNYFPTDESTGALFGYLDCGGVICNLVTRGKIETSFGKASGIVYKANSAVVHNCATFVEVKSFVKGDATHGGIVAVCTDGSVWNCFSAMKINGEDTENCGGIIGWSQGERVYGRNNLSLTQMNIKSTGGCGAISRNSNYVYPGGRNYGHYYQNFFLTPVGDNGKGEQITAEQLASGEVCYRLNAGMEHPQWFQKEGDPYPLPIQYEGATTVGASVAANCMVSDLASDATFTFGGGQASAQHEMYHGRCKYCGFLPLEEMEFGLSGNGIVLRDKEDARQYDWYRYYAGNAVNAIMEADIDMGDDPYFGNPENWTKGIFNGNGHKLTLNITDRTLMTEEGYDGPEEWAYTAQEDKSVDPAGLRTQPFKQGHSAMFFNLTDLGQVHDLHVSGHIQSVGNERNRAAGSQFAATVTNEIRASNNKLPCVYNLYSDVEIESVRGGDNSNAGIIGKIKGDASIIIENTVFAGSIVCTNGGTNCGGIIGWAGGPAQIKNTLMVGGIQTANGDDSYVIARNPGNTKLSNVWYDTANLVTGAKEVKEAKNIDDFEFNMEDGSLTYNLNNNATENVVWTQTLGEDAYPLPLNTHNIVYAYPSEGFRCDGQPMGDVVYSNDYKEKVIPDHEYENGFCHNCGNVDFNFVKPNEEGVYEIGSAAQLANFSHMINSVDGMLSAKFALTKDINMEEYITIDGEDITFSELFLPIGMNEGKPFTGEFDGRLHVISGLKINFPDNNGVGFFGHVGSYSADKPVKIENIVLDNTCSIHGAAYVGLIGQSDKMADGSFETNVIVMNNIGVECEEITCTGANAGGVIGCCMSSQASFYITNCYVTAGLIKAGREASALTGWFGTHAHVKSCWTNSKVEGYDSESKYFGRLEGINDLVDCYCLYGTQVPNFAEEDLASGKLAWNLNGKSFANPSWFQNVGDDDYPTVKSYQGSVFCLGDEYHSATDDKTEEAAAKIIDYEKTALVDVIAQEATIKYFQGQLDALAVWKTMHELGTAYDALDRDSLKKSVDAYAAYKAAVEDVRKKLENEYSTLEGKAVDELKAYLATAEEDIYKAGQLNVEEINAESAKVYAMLDLAIRTCYGAGSDVTDLMANADFSKNLEGWTFADGKTPSVSRVENIKGDVCYAIEYWNKTFNMSQTIEGLKPGVYEFTINGAYRPSDNIYSYNHAAYIYANGIRNYIQTSGEDMLEKGKEVNGLNAYINAFTTDKTYSGTYDFCYFEDPQDNVETSNTEAFNNALGSISRNPVGMALAAKAGRYVNKVLAVVGEDGKLTIGACNPGSKYGADGTLLANAKLKYLGTEENADLTEAYASMVARATSVGKDYNTSVIKAPAVPNFASDMKQALETAAEAPASLEAAQTLSELFAEVYDCKLAYKKVYINSVMMDKVSEDTESYVNIPDGVDPLYTEGELDDMYGKGNALYEAYYSGSFTFEQAKNHVTPELLALGVPEQDENGAYLVGNARNLVFLAAYVNHVNTSADITMTSDIDMAGVNFPGFGSEQQELRYTGTFDGQGHKLSNLWINRNIQGTGFFNYVGNSTIKNVEVDASCVISGGPFTAFIGEILGDYTLNVDHVASSATVTSNAQNAGGLIGCCRGAAKEHVTNCYVGGTITGTREAAAIAGWLANNTASYVRNCLSDATVSGVEGSNYFFRGENIGASNNYSLNGGNNATKVSAEQLASGEIAYKLNGSTSENPLWFQTLGVNAIPMLYGSSDIVYNSGGEYTNEHPYDGMNAFAYDVKVKSNAEQVEVTYTLNADAKAVKIVFKHAETVVKEVAVSEEDLTAGEHTVTIANSEIAEAGTEVTFDVEVTPKDLLDPYHVSTFELPVWAPQGMAINNVPTSAGFGQIYVTNAQDMATEGQSGEGYLGNGAAGLYTFTPGFGLINEEAYTGGMELKGKAANYDYDPRTVRVSEDGRVFIGTTTAKESPLYEADAADLSAEWTPIFQGGTFDETTGVVYVGEEKLAGPMISFDVTGKGADLKIAALMCNEAFKKVNVKPADTWTAIYNIGTDKAITAAPAAKIEGFDGMFTCTPATVNLLADQRGGYWFFQYRANPNETFPAIKHVNAEGKIDYSDIVTALPGGAATVSADGKTIAIISAANKITLYETDYVVNEMGRITLKERISLKATNAAQLHTMAFDYAGNLYTGSADAKRLDCYTIPSNGAEKVTPSVDTFKIGDNYTGIEDVKVVGPMAKGYIYNLSGQRQSKMQRGVNIVNGQKILK